MVSPAYVSRIIFRLLAYPALIYVSIIYYQAKRNDPDSVEGMKRAFAVPEFASYFAEEELQTSEAIRPAEPIEFESEIEIDYPLATPKVKEVKLPAQSLLKDLKELRQVLFDLAMQCHQLEAQAHIPIDQSECYLDTPYHERIYNGTMAEYAKFFSVLLLKTSKHIDASFKGLKVTSNADLKGLNERLTAFARSCGSGCKPLAEAVHGNYPLDQDEIASQKLAYKTQIDSLKSLLITKLASNNENISSLRHQETKGIKEIEDHPLSSPTFIKIHNQALKQLNDNFKYITESGVITSENIDSQALSQLTQHTENITIN